PQRARRGRLVRPQPCVRQGGLAEPERELAQQRRLAEPRRTADPDPARAGRDRPEQLGELCVASDEAVAAERAPSPVQGTNGLERRGRNTNASHSLLVKNSWARVAI